jgi:hypothetical protein
LSGDHAAVGVSGYWFGSTRDYGEVFFYERGAGGEWSLAQRVLSPDPTGADKFSGPLALDGNRALIVGSEGDQWAAYVFDHNGTSWIQEDVLILPSLEFPRSLALNENRVIFGFPTDDTLGNNAGIAYVFEYDGSAWSEPMAVHPAVPTAYAWFGFDVDISGDRLIAGAFHEELGDLPEVGAAYTFEFDGASWVETQRLAPAQPGFQHRFGWRVSLLGDRALVGMFPFFDGFNELLPVVEAFEHNGDEWSLTGILEPNEDREDWHDGFGISLSLSGDSALIGSPESFGFDRRSGAAFLFEFDGLTWNQSEKLVPSYTDAGQAFGESLQLEGDRILVGAPGEDAGDEESGAIYFFDRAGSGWDQTSKLRARDTAWEDFFGSAVVVDGDFAFLAARGDGDNGRSSGSVSVFLRDGDGEWLHLETLTASDGAPGDEFGTGLDATGNSVWIGAPGSDAFGRDSGAAYHFEYDGDSWVERQKFAPSDASFDYEFGFRISANDNRVAISAPGAITLGDETGAVYILESDNGDWVEAARITSDNPLNRQRLGSSIDLEGDRLVAGALGGSSLGGFGSAFIFDFDGSAWSQSADLEPSISHSWRRFGYAAVLHNDKAFVSGVSADVGGNEGVGAVFEFTHDGGSWVESQIIASGAPETSAYFGTAIDIAGQDLLITDKFDSQGGPQHGAAHLFRAVGSSWSHRMSFVPREMVASGHFGVGLALDGRTALVGAEGARDVYDDSGQVFSIDIDVLFRDSMEALP